MTLSTSAAGGNPGGRPRPANEAHPARSSAAIRSEILISMESYPRSTVPIVDKYTWIHFRYRSTMLPCGKRSRGRMNYSPLPGSSEKYFSNLSGTPFQASASGGGVPLRVMLGHLSEKSVFSLSHFSALPSESGMIAAGGD